MAYLRITQLCGVLVVVFVASTTVVARQATPVSVTSLPPLAYCHAYHSIGKIDLTVTNGANTTGWWFGQDVEIEWCAGKPPQGAGGYPKGSGLEYSSLMGLWVGGVLGDTLVSTGDDLYWAGRYEFFPDVTPFGDIVYRSTLDPQSPAFANALAEEEYIAVCADTFTGYWPGLYPDAMSSRPHKPLGIEATLHSFAWSPGYADDFILIEYTIRNIGTGHPNDMFAGVTFHNGVSNVFCETVEQCEPYREDDLSGLIRTRTSESGCPFEDTLNLVWSADADGDPINGGWRYTGITRSSRSVTGIRLLGPREAIDTFSYNWWVSDYDNPVLDFGPRARHSKEHPFRNFGTGGIGTPTGDLNHYHVMSNHEIDYNQIDIKSISLIDRDWMYPEPMVASRLAIGGAQTSLLSIGPFDLAPGESYSFVYAYVGGENLHVDPFNYNWLLRDRPDLYMQGLNWEPFITNARWAEWVYDNPGVDTDSDGYAGAYRVCVLDSQFIDDHWVIMAADTTWYKGDGVPDWRAVQPPPAPTFWLEPTLNGIRVRFNGQRSETTKDIFSGIIDFEGYRIYMGRDERESSLSLAASYDKENYDIYVWNPKLYPSGDFEIQQRPSTLAELRCRFGAGINPCDDSTFAPLAYTRTDPWRSKFFADSVFYFMPHENNVSNLGVATPIRKVYPEALPPGPTDTVTADDLTTEGYLKCYEYECFIENLLPTVSYYVNVTAFDFGSPEADLEALETSKLLGIQSAYAFADANQSDSTLPPVYIYPNPYRYDAHYRDMGYEGRASNRIDDRERRVHFVNVPAKCTIRIHTLDGDLVRELRHDEDPSDPNSHHATWDLINRNVQAIVSGLYYWTVESPDGSVQMGKLVVIQ